MATRPIDTSQLGAIRFDSTELGRKEARAAEVLDKHSPPDVGARTKGDRRR